MVTKSKMGLKKGRVQVGKLKFNKETITLMRMGGNCVSTLISMMECDRHVNANGSS